MKGRSTRDHYLTLIIPSLRKHADAVAFRPYIGRTDAWDSVTYQELERRLAVTRAHWAHTFASISLEPLSVVGFWLTGRKFTDLINIIAVSSLGYTPQLFGSGDFLNASVVLDLMAKSGGKALIIDPSDHAMVQSLGSIPVPHFPPHNNAAMLQTIADMKASGHEDALTFGAESIASVGRDDIAVLFHSSGTTGGMPKIIPNTFKMIRAVILHKLAGLTEEGPPSTGEQYVINNIDTTAHVATFHIFLRFLHIGGCMAQSSSNPFGIDEFKGIRHTCRLTHLAIFGTFLSMLIRAAKTDESVKDALKSLHQISYTGTAMNKEDEDWAHVQGIKVVSSYAATETGPLLRARRGNDASSRLLRIIPGTNPVFLPFTSEENSAVQLFEIAVPVGVDDCPPAEYCGPDGYYHSNDLFEKVEDGYVYRGRAGDWIKTVDGFVDTKTIEDIVRKTCQDVVHDAVVIGTGKLFPCLVVESAQNGLDAEARKAVAQTVVDRIALHSDRLFPHERIPDPRRVIVVEQGTLIRTKTKGNVRRPPTEALFVKELEDIYRTANI